jgi:hypothetical protein
VNTVENIIVTVFILVSPVGLIYGWFFYLIRMRREPRNWRSWITLASLTLASLVVVSWPMMGLLGPKGDWGTGVGVSNQMAWVEAWERAALRTLLVAFVLALCGRPRLILPIAVGCIGAALFWVFSTMP